MVSGFRGEIAGPDFGVHGVEAVCYAEGVDCWDFLGGEEGGDGGFGFLGTIGCVFVGLDADVECVEVGLGWVGEF